MIRVRFHFLLAVVGASWVTVLYRPNAVTIVLAVIFSLSVLTLRDFRRICLLFLLALILIGYSLIGYRSLSMEEGQIAQQKTLSYSFFQINYKSVNMVLYGARAKMSGDNVFYLLIKQRTKKTWTVLRQLAFPQR